MMGSAKGECIRAATARLRSKIIQAKSSSMICKERWLFICIEKRLRKSLFHRLRNQYLSEFEAELRACEKL
jgi:hypothetical protein